MNPKLKLLYVEDEESIREEMFEILDLYFDNIYIAKNGQEGLDMYQKHQPDVVISDIQMPIMDGISMSQEILNINKNATIILTSAFTEQGYLKKSEAIGIRHYIAKPIDINLLLTKIEEVSS